MQYAQHMVDYWVTIGAVAYAQEQYEMSDWIWRKKILYYLRICR